MALDPGERRIGVAVSDDLGLSATPVTVLYRRSWERDLDAIERLVRDHHVQTVVVGWPLQDSGEPGRSALWAERFAERVGARLGCPVTLWDERFSTAEARQFQSPRDRRRGEPIDALAAAVILQQYLDAQR